MTEETADDPRRLARYECLIYHRNNNPDWHPDRCVDISVLAATRQEAVNRAVDIGWAGRPEDARVHVKSIRDEADV